MKSNLPNKEPEKIDSGFGEYESLPGEDQEPVPYTKPTVLFDQETVRVLNWEALSN